MQSSFQYPDGSEYLGDWNEDGQRHGYGELQFADHAKYRGQFENGLFHGLGCITYPDGSRYDGEFYRGVFHGLGVFTRCDGMTYEGQFQDGKVYGLGCLKFNNEAQRSSKNEGFFEDNKLSRNETCSEILQKAIAVAEHAKAQQKSNRS